MTTTSPFPAKRALLIGIGRYAHLPPERQLHGPPADVAALADLLTNAHAFDHITTLVDEQATRKAILNAFADLVDATQPGDLVLIHYSGHGSRVPDIHGDEADGWDSSLVPHDGRDPDGLAPDILDDELNPFFGRLVNERQAGDLVLIFDSCHSAGMTRADGDAPFPAWSRSLEPPTPVAGSRLVESAAAASAAPPPMWQPAGEQFIAFYACQGAESAFELKLTANTVRGALSHALLTALAGGEVKTYRDLWESVSLRVAQISPQQRPQVEGHLDYTIFGREAVRQMFYVPVLGMTPSGLVRLGGGLALGLDVGDRLRLAPPGTRRLSQVGSGALVEIVPLGLTLHQCQAAIVSGSGGQAGQWALLETTRPAMQLRVAVNPAAANAPLIAKLQKQPLLAVVDRDAAVTVEVSAAETRFLDDKGQPLLPGLPRKDFLWQTDVVERLAGLAWQRNFLRLANPDSRLAGSLRLELTDAAGRGLTMSSPQQAAAEPGAVVRLSVTNTWARDLHVAVLTCQEGAEPVQFWPPGSGASLPLTPGRPLTLELPPGQASVVIKLFAATQPIPFELLTHSRTRREAPAALSALGRASLQAQGVPAPPPPPSTPPPGQTRTVTEPSRRRDDDDWIAVQALVTRGT